MQPSRSKLAALIVSSVVTALAVWLVLRSARRAEPAEVHRARFADAPLAPPTDGAPRPGVHPFDATQPVFPPSNFRRWPLTPEEVRGLQQPALRILVTGDSHTDGVCNNSESFTNLLEAELSAAHPGEAIEALNAGKGAYSFYNYLGVLERLLPLRPDVFVVAVYGGNDFVESLALRHTFEHGAPPTRASRRRKRCAGRASLSSTSRPLSSRSIPKRSRSRSRPRAM
jgi:hypothetical protein